MCVDDQCAQQAHHFSTLHFSTKRILPFCFLSECVRFVSFSFFHFFAWSFSSMLVLKWIRAQLHARLHAVVLNNGATKHDMYMPTNHRLSHLHTISHTRAHAHSTHIFIYIYLDVWDLRTDFYVAVFVCDETRHLGSVECHTIKRMHIFIEWFIIWYRSRKPVNFVYFCLIAFHHSSFERKCIPCIFI